MTVTFPRVWNFGDLPLDEAKDLLYNALVPACESKQVFLSQYGNHNALGSLKSMAQYVAIKARKELFNVERVQNAFKFISAHFLPSTRYTQGSYGLKHTIERIQGNYLSNGDLIAAMLMNGFTARFAKRGDPMSVNCEFKLKSFSEAAIASQTV